MVCYTYKFQYSSHALMHLSSIGPVRGSGEQGIPNFARVSTHPNTGQNPEHGLYHGIASYPEYKKNSAILGFLHAHPLELTKSELNFWKVTYNGSERGWSLGESSNFTFAEDLKIEFLGIIKLRKLFSTEFG